MDDIPEATLRIVDGLQDVDRQAWDACAVPDGPAPDTPFVSHAFLGALEDSGSVGEQTGWLPRHLLLEDAHGGLDGCVPMYVKGHSMGEYVFDHGWADAFESAGGRYYPKLQVAVPFTPVTGRRLLARPGAHRQRVEDLLLAGCMELTQRLECSSLHLTFLAQDQWRRMGALGLLQRTDQQFRWANRGYGCFEDFLAQLSSRKRKAVRRERAGALASDDGPVEIRWVTGGDLHEAHWDRFHDFYADTGARKWGRPYLTRSFFSLVGERMASQIVLILARRNGRDIAGALNFIGGNTLYGRHWGCVEDHRFLHFEVCYYQAMEFAIAHGLKYVEAGAQGPHKLARGYMPVPTHSAHYIAHGGLRDAVARYLDMEREHVAQHMEALAAHAPFRRNAPPGLRPKPASRSATRPQTP